MTVRWNIIMISFLLACIVAFITPAEAAQTQTTFTYQGKLTDAGAPANGTYDFEFKLYDTADTQVGSTVTVEDVPVVNGVFTVQLDFGSVFDGSMRTLEIGVRPGESKSQFTTLAPRQPVTSTPESIHSMTAETANSATQLDGIPASGFLQNTTEQQPDTNFNISGNGLIGGNVGIGTTSPVSRLHLANASNFTAGLLVEASEGDRAAMYYAPNTGLVFDSFRPSDLRRLPLLFQPNGGFVGIGTAFPLTKLEVVTPAGSYGITHSGGGISLGSYVGPSNSGATGGWLGTLSNHSLHFFTNNGGSSMTIDLAGNVGIGTSTPFAGIRLDVNGGAARIAPGNGGAISLGTPNAETGMIIQDVIGSTRADIRFDGTVLRLVAAGPGAAPPSTNGISITTAGNVAIGLADPTQVGGWLHVNGGNFIGVYGNSNTYGVRGEATGNLGVGVQGKSSASNGYGLFGESTGNVGFGVYAKGLRYGGYFDGNVHITGALSGPTGQVKIDHPVDPANKYLSHSVVDSPDMMNIYTGNVTTDERGEATINLPGYFEALNREFRYQLTVIGQFAQAIVLSEISNNRFTIKTDKARVKVSWQVTGIRQDAYANANRVRAEEAKPQKERGYYLHPELFNQPEEKGIEWANNPEMMRRNKQEREKTKLDKPSQPQQ